MRKKSFFLSDCGLSGDEYLSFDRLYAFNEKNSHVPIFKKGTRIILDSGAFHLDKAKKSMNAEYISAMFDFYNKYAQREDVFCIAPDVVGNAKKSMEQYEKYATEQKKIAIVPVLQLPKKHIDLTSLVRQCEFYKKFSPKMVAFANNFGRASESILNDLKASSKIIRHYFKDTWIHVLGAGYDCQDALNWISVGFDSCDSLSYYTCAQKRELWISRSNECEIVDFDVQQIALQNAKIVDDCIKTHFFERDVHERAN